MSEPLDNRRRLLWLVGIGALALMAVIAVVTRTRHLSPQATQFVGLWRMSDGPGHRVVLRMTPDGNCEQVAFSSEGAPEGQWSWFTWDVDDDAILATRVDPKMSLLNEWMADLYFVFIGSSQATRILSVTDSQFTIQGRDGPIVYERIQSDPAFPDVLD